MAKETFQAGIQYLSFYLGEAMADEGLISYLRTNHLDIIRAKELRLAWEDGKTRLEKVVEDYLAVHGAFFFFVASPEPTHLNRDGTRCESPLRSTLTQLCLRYIYLFLDIV